MTSCESPYTPLGYRDNAESALGAVAALVASCASATGFPLPRAGAHHGSAVARGDDYLGGAVNLAARVTGHASGGQVLATAVVADAARAMALDVMELGAHRLRNVSQPVELFEVRLGVCEASDTVDPVCRMRVEREDAAGSSRYLGQEYWFCSLACVAAFASDPNSYAAASPPGG
jgi:adenylate cyclase